MTDCDMLNANCRIIVAVTMNVVETPEGRTNLAKIGVVDPNANNFVVKLNFKS